MAKRFTDTTKWDKAWFRKLTPKLKCTWMFLCDRCDHAGIWNIDEDAFSYFIGEDLNLNSIESAFGEKIRRVKKDKLFIPGFIEFQYGELNPENRVHKSVLSQLKKEGAYKVLGSPLEGAKDKDKDKDKDNIKGEYEGKINFLYENYPRREGRSRGLKILAKEIKSENDLVFLATAINNYAQHCKTMKLETKYIKLFSTFASEWRDWIERQLTKEEIEEKNFLEGKSLWE